MWLIKTKPMFRIQSLFIALLFCSFQFSNAQDYFFKDKAPFNPEIPSPEAFLGYPIGEQHTRHDQIVAYLTELAALSDRATISTYMSIENWSCSQFLHRKTYKICLS